MNIQERREFLKIGLQGLGLTMCAGSIVTLLSSCEMNEDPMQPTIETYPFVISLDDSNNATLAEIGGAMYYNVETLNNGLDFIIIRVDETEFLALSSICTHQGCQVSLPTIDTPNIVCPCHMAEFSANNGAVIKQPSEGTATNLPVFRTEYIAMDNRLTVYLPGND